MSRASKKTATAPRLRVGANAEKLMRALLASSDPVALRRMASNPNGRTELERLQRVAGARVDEFRGCLELARSVEASISDALRSTNEAAH